MDTTPLAEDTSPSMRAHFRLPLVILLAGVLLTSTVLVSPHLVEHEFEHGNHHSNSHSSPLCAWFCSAGQAMETSLSLTDAHLACTDHQNSFLPSFRRNVPPARPFTRGPPLEA